jgi:AcrR family transcriptional regulator
MPSPAKTEPRWARRKHARPEEITAAALELFVERGYAGTRLEDVAASAGISKGTLYLYFANKEELFKAVVREGLVSPIAEMRGLVDHFEGSTLELLRMMLFGWWERIGASPIGGIPKLVISEAGNFPELARFYLAEVVEPAQAATVAIVERGIARGEFRKVNADVVARLMAAPMLGLLMWRNALEPYSKSKLDPLAYLETHLDMLRHGLAKE